MIINVSSSRSGRDVASRTCRRKTFRDPLTCAPCPGYPLPLHRDDFTSPPSGRRGDRSTTGPSRRAPASGRHGGMRRATRILVAVGQGALDGVHAPRAVRSGGCWRWIESHAKVISSVGSQAAAVPAFNVFSDMGRSGVRTEGNKSRPSPGSRPVSIFEDRRGLSAIALHGMLPVHLHPHVPGMRHIGVRQVDLRPLRPS